MKVRESRTESTDVTCPRALFSPQSLQRFVKELKWSTEPRLNLALTIRAELGASIENTGVRSQGTASDSL